MTPSTEVDAATEALHREIAQLREERDAFRERYDATEERVGRLQAELNQARAMAETAGEDAERALAREAETAAAAAAALESLEEVGARDDRDAARLKFAVSLLGRDPAVRTHLATVRSLQDDMAVVVKERDENRKLAAERLAQLKELGTMPQQRAAVANYQKALNEGLRHKREADRLSERLAHALRRIDHVREQAALAVEHAPGFVWGRKALALRIRCINSMPPEEPAREG